MKHVEVAARLPAERTGMRVSDGLRARLAVHLEAAARARGQTPERYAAGLAGDPDAFQAVLDRVTVQESRFFRHPDQFAALGREVLPALEAPVVVWSAGCANGQEAYSLAMELAASGHDDWQVLATDVSAAAVARARAGRYSAAELAAVPAVHRHWLRPAGELWEVDPALRRRVRIERADLTARFPVDPGRCQVVFCRNVLLYLDRTVTEAFLDRLATWLAPGGLVFLGYSEAVLAPTARLRVERVGDTHALRVVSGSHPPEGAVDNRIPRFRVGLPSRSGAPETGGSGSATPTAAELAKAGEVAAARGTRKRRWRPSARPSSSTRTSRAPGSSSGWPWGRCRTGTGPGGRLRPGWPPSTGVTGGPSRPGWTGGRRTSWPACEMPQLDGHAVLARIKADPRLADIPVVFVTATVTTDDVVEGLRHGAHDYLRKPFEPSELLARVHAAVRSKALQDELRLRNAELELASRTDALTGLSNRRHLEEQLQRLAAEGDRLSVLLCDMTGSSRSTTPAATPPATRSCGWWPGGCGPPPGRATRPGAGAARSSWSCCPAPAAPRRPPWASGPGWRSRPPRSRWPTSRWP